VAGATVIVAGFGFRAAATAVSLQDALARAAGPRPVAALAAPEDKARADAFRAFAATIGLPVLGVAPGALRAAGTLTCSPVSLAARGAGSVAEAAALAAAGEGARLLAPRAVSGDGMATCALAEGRGA
jgi:cobalt-precorrin 5A hydrolase